MRKKIKTNVQNLLTNKGKDCIILEKQKGENMLKKILLDTNMLIYLEDDREIDLNVAKLTRIIYDSNEYKIVIHPNTLIEANKIKDERRRLIFKSKISVYKQIENPPKATEEFHRLVKCKNENDKIDNELLFAVKQNCVSFFITNDLRLKRKAEKIGLGDRVLKIEEAITKFGIQEKRNSIITPVFIREEYLYQIQLEDSFFDTLREDYENFDDWFIEKQIKNKKAYVSKNFKDEITSFLMLKVEDQDEKYENFEKKFEPKRRLKISTFKVDINNTGKRIGETFIKIIMKKAIEENVDEIYITVFPKYRALIEMLEKYGFEYNTYKYTKNKKGDVFKEYIFLRNLRDKDNYPFIKIKEQNIFIIPIQPNYHKLLFPEAIKEAQIKISDYNGTNTASNAIRKAYISNSKIKKIKKGDILLFYASRDRKAITSIGIVDAVFNSFENIEDIINLVKKRTAYEEKELKENVNIDSLVIMFKHYMSFTKDIEYKWMLENNIVNGYIQCPIEIEKESLIKIINEAKEDVDFFEIN